MSYFSNAIAASQTWEVWQTGKFFRMLASSGACRVEFFSNGSLQSVVDNVQGGFWRESDETFDRVRVTDMSGGSNTVEIVTDMAKIGYDRLSISGAVVVEPTRSASGLIATTAIVTTISSVLRTSEAHRKWLMIQNRDAVGNIYVVFGNVATIATGIKIGPGQTWESGLICPTASVQAIGDVASNPNVFTCFL